jgi:hypothetical protein
MAWLPISGTIPQYSTISNALASDYYLKFYAAGTATPINMATDSTGGTLLAKCALSTFGCPITNPLDISTRFIPHIDQNYRIVLFKNEADADSNNTAEAAFNIDGMALQIAPSADASDITLRDTNVEIQDDYDRSPLFIDTDGFTAGAGPHVVTVPTVWTPTNADMRFYKVDASGIVVPLTPTSTSATTFTLAETLLSTDVIFIGDDTFRNLHVNAADQTEANASSGEKIITVTTLAGRTATETLTGLVEKATDAEMTAGTTDKYPDCETIKAYYGDFDYEEVTKAGDGALAGLGSITMIRVGSVVTISSRTGFITGTSGSSFSTASNFIPTSMRPTSDKNVLLKAKASETCYVRVLVNSISHILSLSAYDENTGAAKSINPRFTDEFTISYIV